MKGNSKDISNSVKQYKQKRSVQNNGGKYFQKVGGEYM